MRSQTAPAAPSPVQVFVLILCVAFLVEGAIMIALPHLSTSSRRPVTDALIDTLTLTVGLAPTLWFLVVRPLRTLINARGTLLTQLFEAHEQERGRVARELHDELGQHLTAVLLHLRTIDRSQTLAEARDRAAAAHAAAGLGLEHVRRIARALRPVILEDLGLVPAVERLCEEFRATSATSFELKCSLDPSARFAPEAELCVYRVLQESLTNIARHADAKHVRVSLDNDSGLRLVVADDGRGFDASRARGSLGLYGIHERVESLGGRCSVRSSNGAGATITAIIPLTARTP